MIVCLQHLFVLIGIADDSDEFKGAVHALAKALGVPPSGEDHKATLLVCLTLLEGRLPLTAGGAASPLSPADLPVGFDTGDKAPAPSAWRGG